MKLDYFKIVNDVRKYVEVKVCRNVKLNSSEYYDYVNKIIHVIYEKNNQVFSLERLIHEFAHFFTATKIKLNKKECVSIENNEKLSKRHEVVATMITIEVMLELGYMPEDTYYLTLFGVEYSSSTVVKYKKIISEVKNKILQIIGDKK